MVDWNTLVLGPLNTVFGEPVTYTLASGIPIQITGIFDEAYTPVELVADPSVNTARPVLGVRLSEFPADWAPERAQGEQITIQRSGVAYVVKSGKPDGHGHARLELNQVSL